MVTNHIFAFNILCLFSLITISNEKLQQYFINYVLKKEQETYDEEGIECLRVTPVDNDDVLFLIESKPTGLFSLLDEELRLPQGSDKSFLKKAEKEHKNKSRRFAKDFRMAADTFEISHFAGVVKYDATNFMEKNRDKLYEHLEELLSESSYYDFKVIMDSQAAAALASPSKTSPAAAASGGKQTKQVNTLVSRFTLQLSELISVLNSSSPHFIRCIKPNNTKSPKHFDADVVLRQLRYSGVLEAVQVRKSGYPTRRPHREFLNSYRVVSGCSAGELDACDSDFDKCEMVIAKLATKSVEYNDIKLGSSLVFYRPNVIIFFFILFE